MVKCAKLDNERSTLLYSVEDLKDQLEDQTELATELKITLKAKCRDIEKLKMQLSQKSKDVEVLRQQVQQREDLLQEKAGIVITQLGDIMEVHFIILHFKTTAPLEHSLHFKTTAPLEHSLHFKTTAPPEHLF